MNKLTVLMMCLFVANLLEAKMLFQKESKGVLIEVYEERPPNADEFGVALPAYHTMFIAGAKGIDVQIISLGFRPVKNIQRGLERYYDFPRPVILNHLDKRTYSTLVFAENSLEGFGWSADISLSVDGQVHKESLRIQSSPPPVYAKEPAAVKAMERAKTAPPEKLDYNVFDRMMLKVPQGRFNYIERKKREDFEHEQKRHMKKLEDEVEAKAEQKQKEEELRRKRQRFAANCQGEVTWGRDGRPTCTENVLGFDARAVANSIQQAGNQVMQARQQAYDNSQAMYRASSPQKTYSKPQSSSKSYEAPKSGRSEERSSIDKKKMEVIKKKEETASKKGITIPWNGHNVTDDKGKAYAYGSDRSYNSKAGRANSNYNSSSSAPRPKRVCTGQLFTTDNGTTIELPGGLLAEHREVVCMGSDNVEMTPHYYQFQCLDGEWKFIHRLWVAGNDEQKERCRKHSDARVTLGK